MVLCILEFSGTSSIVLGAACGVSDLHRLGDAIVLWCTVLYFSIICGALGVIELQWLYIDLFWISGQQLQDCL